MSNRFSASVRSRLAMGLIAAALPTLAFVGCERKEKIIDVETQEGELEVERNIDTGEVEVEVRDR